MDKKDNIINSSPGNGEPFKTLFDNINDGISIIENGKVVYANDKVLDILGFSRDETHLINGVDCAAPEEKSRIKSFQDQIENSGTYPEQLEFWIEKKDTGEKRYIRNRFIKGESSGSAEIRYVVTSDITEYKITLEKLTIRESILGAISFASQRFLQSYNWRKYMNEVLEKLGKATRVSRGYLFQNHLSQTGELLASQRFEWVSAGVEAQIENEELQNIPYKTAIGELYNALIGGKVYNGLVKNLSEEMRAILEPQDIVSIIIVPVYVNEKLWGFLGFDDCMNEREWTNSEIDILRTAADIIGSAIQKQLAQKKTGYRKIVLRKTVQWSP